MTVSFNLVAGGGAGEASHIAVAALGGPPQFITAMRNGSGNLELIGWIMRDNTLTRAGTALAGAVSEVALTIAGQRAVTAVRDGSGRLFLISWDCSSQLQSITKAGDSSAAIPHPGAADLIAITPALTEFGQQIFVTALRNGSGNLELISWRLESSGNFTRLGDSGSQAGGVDSVAVTSVGSNLVVTAVQTTHSILQSHGKLKLIAWQIFQGGAKITRIGDENHLYGEAGEVSEVAIAPTSGDFPGVLTAVKNGSGNLEVIAWGVARDTGFTRLGDNQTPPNNAGTASHIAITHAGNLQERYLTSMRRGSGDLELIAFDFTTGPVKRVGDHGSAQGNDVTETALAHLADGQAIVADRLRNFLNVQLWQLT
jgi:ketopantoate reductase